MASSTLAPPLSCVSRRRRAALARALSTQLGQPGVRIVADRSTRSDRQLVRLERREVAQRLGVDERAERLLPAGDRQVVGVVGRSAG